MAKLTGTNSGDLLTGTSSADALYGLGGSDILKGGGGADYIDGGADLDLVSYIHSGAAVQVDLNVVVQQGGDAAGDQLYNVEAVTGSAYADTLTGNGSDNTFKGGGGADIIDGRGGSDTVSYDGSGSAVQINLATTVQQGGEAANDRLTSIENVIGSAYGDTLRGSSALNRLEGRAGDDSLFGGFDGRVDVLDGGAGTDTVDYTSAQRGMTLALGETVGAGSATLNEVTRVIYDQGGRPSGFSIMPAVQEDALYNVENVVGTGYDDYITGNGGDNRLDGGAGRDTFIASGGHDDIDGGPGRDTLVLSSSSGAGARVVFQYYSENVVYLADDDVIDFTGIENVFGTDYGDEIYGSDDANMLNGRGGSDLLLGYDGDDTLRGGDDIDVLHGMSDNDFLFGGDGNDVLSGGSGADHLDGEGGTNGASYGGSPEGIVVDLMWGTAGYGDASGDTLVNIHNVAGSDFGDTLRGTNGNNLLRGRADDDTLEGREGSDTIDGGRGDDDLYGGADDDAFHFDLSADIGASGPPISIGHDTIHDWESGVDQIVTSATAVMRASQVGAHTVITFDGVDGSITVLNAQVTDFV